MIVSVTLYIVVSGSRTVRSGPSARGWALISSDSKVIHQLSSVVRVVARVLKPNREIVVVQSLRNELRVAAYFLLTTETHHIGVELVTPWLINHQYTSHLNSAMAHRKRTYRLNVSHVCIMCSFAGEEGDP